MPNNDPTAALILGEMTIILSVCILALLAGMLLRKRKQSRLLSAMLHRVTDNEENRKQMLRASLSGVAGIDGNTIESLVSEIVTQENSFYRLISSAFIENKTGCIEHLDDEVQKLVSPYGKLFSGTTKAAKPSSEETANLGFDDAIDDLLSDAETATESNPEFDLSATEEATDVADATPSNILGIAEIPEDLLGDNAGTEETR
jgi:hypothetical protein